MVVVAAFVKVAIRISLGLIYLSVVLGGLLVVLVVVLVGLVGL